MKKIFGFIILAALAITMTMSLTALAHTGVDESFDFNNYLDETGLMRKDPPAGTYGFWGCYVPTPADGGGVTSYKEGDNTCVMISQGGKNYNRALDYYANEPMTSSVHYEYSTKMDSALSSRSLQFMFYDTETNTQSSFQTVVAFYGNSQQAINAFGVNTGAKWEADKWYRVSVDYNIISGAFCFNLYDLETEKNVVTTSGTKIFDSSYDSIKRIRFAYSSGNAATSYFDDVTVKTINRFYNSDFCDFEDFSVVGNDIKTQNTYELDENGYYATIEAEKTEKGQSLAFKTNTQKGLSILKLGLSMTGTVGIDYSLYLCDAGSMRRVQISGTNSSGKSGLYGKLLEIKNGYNKVFFCGQDTGEMLSNNVWYDIKMTYNPEGNCARLEVWSEGKIVFSYDAEWTADTSWDNDIVTVNSWHMDLGYNTITTGKLTTTYMDDITVCNKTPFFIPGEGKDYPMAIASSVPSTASLSADPLGSFTVTYTNEIDQSSVLPENILINGEAVLTADDITFADKYTIKVNYQLKEGTNYHIVLNNVKNVDGEALSDFVEFQTKLADVEFSGFGYSKMYNGEKLALGAVSDGDVTASVTVWANGGKEYELMHFMALYNTQTGALEDVRAERFSPNGEKTVHSLTMTISEEQKTTCEIKSFLWEMNGLKPLQNDILPATGNGPVVILKLDDVRGRSDATSYNNFDKIYDYAVENNIPMAFGVIGNSLEVHDQDYYDTLKKWDESGLVEVWHHGYYHSYFNENGEIWAEGDTSKYGEYKLSYEKQLDSFSKTYNLLKEKAGIEVKSLGAPFNATDDTTVEMLNENYPGVKVVMTALDEINLPQYTVEPNFLHLTNRINVESATGVFSDFEQFKANFASKLEDDYILIQMHGGLWWQINSSRPEEQFTRFTQMVDYMKECGATFMTPYNYYLETTKE